MKNLSKLMFLSFLIIFISSCGDDVDCDAALQNQNLLSAEVSAIITAGTNYYSDETDANCQAYKDAIKTFLDEAKKYDDCFEGSTDQADYRESIQEAETELNDLGC